MEASRWLCPQQGQAWIMGVLNCTPDSFSDGGKYLQPERALEHAREMIAAGAAMIDVGGESSRPGAVSVPLEEELRRVIPVVQVLVQEGMQVSIDTSKPEVMRQAMGAGACMVNDITALRGDSQSPGIVAETDAEVCLMHMQGRPGSMQDQPRYGDVVAEVETFFRQRIDVCIQAGIKPSRIVIDPGIGFGKRLEDNLALIAHIPRFKALGFPVLIGISRKSFLGAITDMPVSDREVETAAAVGICIYAGADVLRVHDVSRQSRAIKVASAIAGALPKQPE